MAMAAMEAVRRCVARRGGSRRRGGARGLLRCSRGARWLRLRRAVASVAFGRERERETEERTRARESARGSGWLRGVVRGIEGDEKGARQAGREVAWRGGARARRARAVPLSGRKTTEEGGQVGWAACWLGRPAAAGLHRGEPQVSPSFFLFLFSNFSDIVLI